VLYLNMENHNKIILGENKITLKYETETLTFEKQKNPQYIKGTEYIDVSGDRYFLTKKKS
jgi:hypothetical protein